MLAVALALAAVAAWRIVQTVVLRNEPTSLTGLLYGSDAQGLAASQDRPLAVSGAALARAKALLASEPLTGDAYTVLGLAAAGAGRDEEAARLMRIAAASWPRDTVAQTWLLDRDLRLADHKSAMTRLDVMLRTSRPEALDVLTEAMAPVFRDRAGAAALADLLATDPPWRTRFIDVAIRQWREPDGLIGLIERLQARPPGLSAAELRPVLVKLLQTGRVDQAHLTWLRSLPRERLANLGYLYNGGFRYPVSGMPFDWVFPMVPGASAAVSAEGAERVLTVGFLGGRVPLAPVRHDLVLAPGSYGLTGRVRTDRLRAERGARWRIACQDDPDGKLAASEPFSGSSAWRGFAMAFTVPDSGCRAQTLSLEIEARTESERQASGIAAFSGLDIEAR